MMNNITNRVRFQRSAQLLLGLVFAVSMFLSLTQVEVAQAGVDDAFGSGYPPHINTGLFGDGKGATRVTIQSDNKIILVGLREDDFSYARSVAIQSDDKIVVAGTRSFGSP